MTKSFFPIFLFLILSFTACAQEDKKDADTELPYFEIPIEPASYSAEGVAARMIDGLGYRYFWATQGLTKTDLTFRPGETNRTTNETLEHVLGLSKTTLNAIAKKPNIRGGGQQKEELTFAEMRKLTLENFKAASDLLRQKDAKVEDMKIVFQRGENKSEFPFWNLINGPIADAIWHTGQIVSYRRASGNPLPPGVNVFRGKTKE